MDFEKVDERTFKAKTTQVVEQSYDIEILRANLGRMDHQLEQLAKQREAMEQERDQIAALIVEGEKVIGKENDRRP